MWKLVIIQIRVNSNLSHVNTVASWATLNLSVCRIRKWNFRHYISFVHPSSIIFPTFVLTSNIKSVEEYGELKEYKLFDLPTEARSSLSTRIRVNDQLLRMEVDAGAAFFVSSNNIYKELFCTLPLQHSPVKLKPYSEKSLPPFSINIKVSFDRSIIIASCGTQWSQSLSLKLVEWTTSQLVLSPADWEKVLGSILTKIVICIWRGSWVSRSKPSCM